MCGIAGYIGTAVLDDRRLDGCLALMRRRGPDHAARKDWTMRSGRRIHFLHSRLNIIDLEARSNQPFQVGKKWLVYNGELYNYTEIRRELEAEGEVFSTTSDTEVFLRGIKVFGWEVLDRYEGMWAFAVYDEEEDALVLCRDRFGEKPLYVHRDASGIYFGSETKFIAALLGRRLEIDHEQMKRFLVNGYKSLYKEGQTFFKGLEELPAAHVWRVEGSGRVQQKRYWKPSIGADAGMTFEQAVSGVRERLFRAVEIRLRADVPLAFCMSGGVDSNALIGIAKKELGYDVHGFTIANTDRRYEEQEMVDCAVKSLGLRHTSIPVDTRDFLANMRTLVRQHDAPVFTISYYAHWLLMKSVADQRYRISVSGTGADELFSGYYDHHLAYLYDVREDRALHGAALEAWEKNVRPWVRNPFLGDPDLFVRDPNFRKHIYLEADDFAGYLTEKWAEPFREETLTQGGLLRNRMLNELFYEAVPVILHEDDLNAMYFSVENRSPFLDRALFEYCGRIPVRHLVRNGRAKAVLREALRGIVPDPILDNPRKVGFNAPIRSFLDTADPRVKPALLKDSPVFDWVRREKIEVLLDKKELPNSESKFLFYFLSTKLFLEEFS
ncbi:MAG TPA: asparagine synthase (glutamine-hydrolyzing) [Elusimicrobiota bacterium]|nr:asparagine synthase (glutamine-hydrolyzing) [Elusimicrobiota bacterium]